MGGLLRGMMSGLSSIGDVASALVAFFLEITDFRMWRSLAWTVLGIILLAVGGLLWLKMA